MIFDTTKTGKSTREKRNSGSQRRNTASRIRNQDRLLSSLQRKLGNQAVQNLVERGELQAKLEESSPPEREAEQVATEVVRAEEPLTEEANVPEVQRSPSDGSSDGSAQSDSGAPLWSLMGSGKPLSASTRSYFEPRFGADFSDVRVHIGSRAHRIAQEINANAFTTGNDIAFSKGKYNPTSDPGRGLLAHELTHTLQQRQDAPISAETIQRNEAQGNQAERQESREGQRKPENGGTSAYRSLFQQSKHRFREASQILKQTAYIAHIKALSAASERELEMIEQLRTIERISEEVSYGFDSELVEKWRQYEWVIRDFLEVAEVELERIQSGEHERQRLLPPAMLNEWSGAVSTIGAYRHTAAGSLLQDLTQMISRLQNRIAQLSEEYLRYRDTLSEYEEIAEAGELTRVYIDIFDTLHSVGSLARSYSKVMVNPRELLPEVVSQFRNSISQKTEVIKSGVKFLTHYYQQVELRGKSLDRLLQEIDRTADKMLEAVETLERRTQQRIQVEFLREVPIYEHPSLNNPD